MDMLLKTETPTTNFHDHWRKAKLRSWKDGTYYANSNGLDEYILIEQYYNQAAQTKRTFNHNIHDCKTIHVTEFRKPHFTNQSRKKHFILD
jgi:hypothetical protein